MNVLFILLHAVGAMTGVFMTVVILSIRNRGKSDKGFRYGLAAVSATLGLLSLKFLLVAAGMTALSMYLTWRIFRRRTTHRSSPPPTST